MIYIQCIQCTKNRWKRERRWNIDQPLVCNRKQLHIRLAKFAEILIEKIINQWSTTANVASIKNFHDTTRAGFLALKNIGIETETACSLLLQILIKKLGRNLHIRFGQSLRRPNEIPSIDNLLSLLEFQFQFGIIQVASAIRTDRNIDEYKFCNTGSHGLCHCIRFRLLSKADGLKHVQKQRLCFNSFKGNHINKYVDPCEIKHQITPCTKNKCYNKLISYPSSSTER